MNSKEASRHGLYTSNTIGPQGAFVSVIPFPQRLDAMTLWSKYAQLVREVSEDPALANHPSHTAERLRAHQRFMDAFGRSDAQAS